MVKHDIDTVKPFMLHISRAKRTREIKVRHYTNFNWHYSCVETVWLEFAKIKGVKIILHVKSLWQPN